MILSGILFPLSPSIFSLTFSISCFLYLFFPSHKEKCIILKTHNLLIRSRNSSVVQRWATGWMIGGFYSRQGLGTFFFTTASRPVLGPTQPPIQWVPGALFLGVKRPGCETDHSPLSSARSRTHGTIPPLPQYPFMGRCSFKAQG
jgi:hypothetical protein